MFHIDIRFSKNRYVTVFDKSARREGTFSREEFTYDHVATSIVTPGGKMLTMTQALVNDGATMLYVASKLIAADVH